MGVKTEHQGRCLCGAVQITAKTKNNNMGVCHCTMCRKWGSGPLFAVECGSDVAFEGKDKISTYNSSEWAERGFCQQCGTHLFYRLKETGQYAIPIGLFEDGEQWNLTEQIFIDQKPSFYSLTQKTKELTGKEVFAQYAKD